MNTEFIHAQILAIFKQCAIKRFPINCFAVFHTLGISLIRYSQLSEAKRAQCHLISDDAFTLAGMIYYNDQISLDGRMRFSLLHELGHIVLKHQQDHTKLIEQEANFFASHFLAPRMLIHYHGCKNAQDVAHSFHLSLEASDYAFQDYRRWHRMAIYRMSMTDQRLYDYFYQPQIKKFAYDTHECIYCQREIYNHPHQLICPLCQSRQSAAATQTPDPFSSDSRLRSYLQSQQGQAD